MDVASKFTKQRENNMTDRYKGFVVHLDKDMRFEDCEEIIIALKNIKHVADVRPLTSSIDDAIAYERGIREIIIKLSQFISAELFDYPPNKNKKNG